MATGNRLWRGTESRRAPEQSYCSLRAEQLTHVSAFKSQLVSSVWTDRLLFVLGMFLSTGKAIWKQFGSPKAKRMVFVKWLEFSGTHFSLIISDEWRPRRKRLGTTGWNTAGWLLPKSQSMQVCSNYKRSPTIHTVVHIPSLPQVPLACSRPSVLTVHTAQCSAPFQTQQWSQFLHLA